MNKCDRFLLEALLEEKKMELDLKAKTALVTGSTKGIGKAIAWELAKEGANVIINGRNSQAVDEVVMEVTKQFS